MSGEMDSTITVRERKAALRAEIARMEREISADEYRRSDAALAEKLISLPVYERAASIMLFSPFDDEPSMLGVVEDCRRRRKSVLLPRMLLGNRLECCEFRENENLVPGKYGILEPSKACRVIAPEEIDLIVVPAVCYDRRGYRLGRGAGYYDRLLMTYPGETVGLCRERFLQEEVPREPHDVRVMTVVTEHAVYATHR